MQSKSEYHCQEPRAKSHNYALTLFRIITSGILAFIILSLLSTFYHHYPQHKVDPDDVTDFRNVSHGVYLQGYEVFSFLKTNNEVYCNVFDYYDDMNISIIIMGSSHMEAAQINIYCNTASVLGKISGRTIYNVGMSRHGFSACVSHMRQALRKYKPSEYLIMEIGTLNFSETELKNILEDKIQRISAYDTGILSLLRRNDFLRVLQHQYAEYISRLIASKQPSHKEHMPNNINTMLSDVLGILKENASDYGVKIIIAYHPNISINKDGSLNILYKSNVTARHFSEICARHGIYFLDMSSRFLKEYSKRHILPYGFINSSAGNGHMNKYGHRMFAEEIYSLIQRIEAQS